MYGTKAEIYLHLVWDTWQREPLITEDVERSIYRCIENEATSLKCQVLAIGGIADHVHLVIKLPTTLSVAKLMQQVKGVSSTMAREKFFHDEFFRWREGYGVFSISRPGVTRVVDYVRNQKHHHTGGSLWPSLEATGEDKPDIPQK